MSEAAQATRGKLLSPFNVIAGIILLVGGAIVLLRFAKGLEATTNLTHYYPWGVWIGFDVMSGVALAAGGFVTSSAVYLFGMKEYKPVVRPAILTGFLGYFLVVLGLIVDLGKPWHLPYPFIVQAGPTSALFEVSLCVSLYLTVLFIESSPAALERLGWKRWRKVVGALTIALTIFGLILSTLHQSTLGAMFTITPTKLHPLWYSPYIPVHFFVSAVAAGLSMVIVEGMFSHKAFHDQVQITNQHFEKINFGLAKAGAVTLAIYTAIKLLSLSLEAEWHLLLSGWGAWFLLELVGFVMVPCFLFAVGYRERKLVLIRIAAWITVIGIVLNRFNVSFIAFNYNLPVRYVPHWMEIWVSIALVTLGVVMFRWIANRMPIMYEHPEWKGEH
ncbi:MAG: NrfD/PsrC family molybdoenzyme membrane anchor subunit [Myxococcota bacterium]